MDSVEARSASSGAAARARALRERRRRIAVAQARLDRATARYKTAETQLMALQSTGAPAARVDRARARCGELARDVAAERMVVEAAKAPKRRSR